MKVWTAGRQRTIARRVFVGMAVLTACVLALRAEAVLLSLSYETSARPIQPGDTIVVTLNMSDLGEDEAAGFQSFLEFNDDQMFLVGGTYPDEPFGLAVLPIQATDGEIDLAAGLDPFEGQPPATEDAALAHLTFQATASFCTPTMLFREHTPPTRLTDPNGQEVLPLNLRGLEPPTCLGDIVPFGGDGEVGVADLLELLSEWGAPPPSPADIAPGGCDGEVGVLDLLELLSNWGACPEG